MDTLLPHPSGRFARIFGRGPGATDR